MKYRTRFRCFFLILILFNLAANFAHPVTPTLIKNLNLHDYMFGAALAAMLFTNFLLSPFWGKINTYVSSKVSMLVCCCGYGAAQVFFAVSVTEPQILAARLFAGIFTGGVFTSFLTYVVNTSSNEDRGRHLAICATIQSVASAFGYMIGGFLGEISVMVTFMIQAAVLSGCGILFLLICVPDVDMDLRKISLPQLAKEANPLNAILDGRKFMCAAFVMLFAVNVLMNIGFTSFDQAFNYYLKDVLGLTSSYNGMIKAVVGLVSFVSNMTLCIWIMNKKHVNQIVVLVILVCALGSLGAIVSVKIPLMIGFSILLYAANFVSVPLIQNLVANQAEQGQQNLVMGFYNATKNIGGMVGSLTAGFIYSVDAKLPFLCTLAVFGAAALVMEIFAKYRKPGI